MHRKPPTVNAGRIIEAFINGITAPIDPIFNPALKDLRHSLLKQRKAHFVCRS